MAKKISPVKKAKKAPVKKIAAKKNAKKTSKPKKAVKTLSKVKTINKVKKKGEDLMCFLTTACVGFYALPDDCKELTTLRMYRDNYLLKNDSGKKLVKEYYDVSPRIVSIINKDEKRAHSYKYIYSEVKKACTAINNHENMRAKTIYTNMVNSLRKKYGV